MPLSTKVLTPFKRAITRFDNAAQEYAFIGMAHPEDQFQIEDEYHWSRELLERLIEKGIS